MSRRLLVAGSQATGGGPGPDPDPIDVGGFSVKPYSETVDASVVAATTAYLTYGTPSFSGSRWIPYTDTASLRMLGLTSSTHGTTPVSVGNGQPAGSRGAPFAVEFDITGASQFAAHVNSAGAAAERAIWVFIDGHPTTAAPYALPSGAVRVQLPSTGEHRIRLELADLWFAGLDVPTAAVVAAPAVRAPKLMIHGDSWVEGASYDLGLGGGPNHPNTQNMAWLTGKILDAPTYINGTSGTGYVGLNPPSYGDDARVTQIIYADPDVLVVFGTINDNSKTPGAAATAFFSRLATDLPDCKVIVCGPESYGDATNVVTTNRTQLLAAAAAAPNVVGIIDPIAETWIVGTGTSSSPSGSGNADQYANGLNPGHLTLAGNRYYAERLAAAIAETVPAD